MEQLRHRLTNVSPKGQRRSVDQNTLKRSDLDDFVNCYFGSAGFAPATASENGHARTRPLKAVNSETTQPASNDKESAVTDRRYSGNRHERKETDRFKSFTYEELTRHDKANLDIFWLKDESLEDSANLPDPGVLALEITEDLEAALAQFAEIAADLKR